MTDKRLAHLSLRLIAAKAEKLAEDLDHNRLWEGELSSGLDEITRTLEDARRAARTPPR